MNSLLHRSTALMLSAALLFITGLGDALHMLPGMGHAGHCHGLACHADGNHGHDHAHSHDGHHHGHVHASTKSCCGHSHGPAKTKVANGKELPDSPADTSDDASGDAGEQHECGLCKLLASLKQVTSSSVAMHQWQSLSVAQLNSQVQRPESSIALAYQGRAPPISL